jgi:hypothetical protein
MGDAASLATAKRICLIMGEYFQIQVNKTRTAKKPKRKRTRK